MLLREKVWFPSEPEWWDRNSRGACHAKQQPHVPIDSRTLDHYTADRRPWQEVAVDFVGSFPSGELLLVVVVEFSRFPKVEIVTTTSAKAVIPKLDNIFSRQGVPIVLKSDNGPPFNSSEFEQFASYLGFEHRKVTLYWPKANGEVERFMRTIEKAIRTAHIEKKNWKQALYQFLRQYRATPHRTARRMCHHPRP
jgi:transposase InsO family protein